MKRVSVIGNRAIRMDSPEMQRIIEDRRHYAPSLTEDVRFPDFDEVLGHIGALRFFTETGEANGGGFNLEFQDVASNDIVEIVFQDVVFEHNEAVVGGAPLQNTYAP